MDAELERSPSKEGFSLDLYDRYKFFREKVPVYPYRIPSGGTIFFLSRFSDIAEAMQDKRLSKVNPNVEEKARIIQKYPFVSRFNRRIQDLDPPDHTRLRRLVSDVFTIRGLTAIETDIRKEVVALLNNLTRHDNIDIFKEFAVPLPIIVISKILGFPAQDFAKIAIWSDAMTPLLDGSLGGSSTTEGFRAFEEVSQYLDDLIRAKRRNLGDDLISLLIKSQIEHQVLTDNEIFSMAEIVMNAAHMTTTNLIGNGMYLLLQHPTDLDRLTYDREVLPSAIEEMLRLESPVQAVDYYAKEDISIHGKIIPQGSRIALLVGSANRDAEIFSEPDKFIMNRQPNKHLAFGGGGHFCLGAQLARLEARIAFEVLLTRFPKMQLAGAEPAFRPGYNLRGLSHLFVNLT